MKRILIVLAVLASFQSFAIAQVKPEAAKKALDAAIAASQNEKKATKAATWSALGKAYVNAYDAPTGNAYVGATKTDLRLLMAGENPISTEQVVINGEPLIKEVYANKNLYFDGSERVVAIEITKPVAENALEKAAEAYSKAYALDTKKAKEVSDALGNINDKLASDAVNEYTLGRLAASSALFEKAAEVAALSPLDKVDTNSIYNAGFTAQQAGELAKAKANFLKCLDYGYYSGGDIYAKLADIDTVNTQKYLEEGFEKFPESESIMIGLINYYLKKGEGTDNLFDLLHKAQALDPSNASLWYVEGNTHSQLGDIEKAVEAYQICNGKNPDYEFGYIGLGQMFYEKALSILEEAQNELDDKKYDALVTKYEQALRNCIPSFEMAFAISKDDGLKTTLAEYISNSSYRMINFDESGYTAKKDKYTAISKGEAAPVLTDAEKAQAKADFDKIMTEKNW